jgi:hypothetical protein
LSRYEKTWLTINSPHTALIHILDDDSLLDIFCLYRPVLIDEDKEDGVRFRVSTAGATSAGGIKWAR